jgi:hypothetical protein
LTAVKAGGKGGGSKARPQEVKGMFSCPTHYAAYVVRLTFRVTCACYVSAVSRLSVLILHASLLSILPSSQDSWTYTEFHSGVLTLVMLLLA